jgi:hypothetical protein
MASESTSSEYDSFNFTYHHEVGYGIIVGGMHATRDITLARNERSGLVWLFLYHVCRVMI